MRFPCNLTIYVRPDGSDAQGNGSTNTPAGTGGTNCAFATIQAAYNYAAQHYNLGGYTITLQLGVPGQYAGPSLPNIGITGALIINGDTANPQNYQIVPALLPDRSYSCLAIGMQSISVQGVTLNGSHRFRGTSNPEHSSRIQLP